MCAIRFLPSRVRKFCITTETNTCDSTPGINDEKPRQTSKILQNVKKEKTGIARAGQKWRKHRNI
jgi:hypothetical protein